MNRHLAVGDLVVVIKPDLCCGDESEVGKIFTIADLSASTAWCKACGVSYDQVLAWDGPAGNRFRSGHYLETLQRIKPVKKTEKKREAEIT